MAEAEFEGAIREVNVGEEIQEAGNEDQIQEAGDEQEVNDGAEIRAHPSGRMEYDEDDAILQHICECSFCFAPDRCLTIARS
jgi:hypothetical protein